MKNVYDLNALVGCVQSQDLVALKKWLDENPNNPADLFKPVFVCSSSKQVDFNYYEKEITDILLKSVNSNDDIQSIFEKHPFEDPFN